MGQYSDAYNGLVNYLSHIDSALHLKGVLGKAKEAEQYLEKTSSDIKAADSELAGKTVKLANLNNELKAAEQNLDEASVKAKAALEGQLNKRRLQAHNDLNVEMDREAQKLAKAQQQTKEAENQLTLKQKEVKDLNSKLADLRGSLAEIERRRLEIISLAERGGMVQ